MQVALIWGKSLGLSIKYQNKMMGGCTFLKDMTDNETSRTLVKHGPIKCCWNFYRFQMSLLECLKFYNVLLETRLHLSIKRQFYSVKLFLANRIYKENVNYPQNATTFNQHAKPRKLNFSKILDSSFSKTLISTRLCNSTAIPMSKDDCKNELMKQI